MKYKPKIGDYVLATKYDDGNPHDHWCIGFIKEIMYPRYDPARYDVVDGDGRSFRGNGFRRVKKISGERGTWMLNHSKEIESGAFSVWWWVRNKME